MARTKRTKTEQAKIAARRLLEDEEVQKQLRLAAIRAREAWSRASRRPASKAVSDKKVYAKVREAATSLTTAGRRMRRRPEPPKRTGRKIAVVAALAGGAAYAFKRRSASAQPQYDGQPVAAPPAPFPSAPAPVT
jgi:hypothetical protein